MCRWFNIGTLGTQFMCSECCRDCKEFATNRSKRPGNRPLYRGLNSLNRRELQGHLDCYKDSVRQQRGHTSSRRRPERTDAQEIVEATAQLVLPIPVPGGAGLSA